MTYFRRTLTDLRDAAVWIGVFVFFACLVAYVVGVFAGIIPALPGELK